MLGSQALRTLRRAIDADREWVLALRNEPSVLAQGHGRRAGQMWWTAVRRWVWVVEHELRPVGYVVIKPTHEVSIAIAPDARGQGHAAWALGTVNGIALVDPENKASLAAFKRAGFHEQRRDHRPLLPLAR